MISETRTKIGGFKEIQDMLKEYREDGALELQQYREIGTLEECKNAFMGEKMKINIKKLTKTAIIPTRQHEGDAGYDLYADIQEPITIQPHTTAMIHTGIAVEIPERYFGAVFARSGLAFKQGLRPANCTGVIDNGYTGECMVVLHNDSDIERVVSPGNRIAQLVVIPYLNLEFDIVDELSDSERGDGGFGSTGR